MYIVHERSQRDRLRRLHYRLHEQALLPNARAAAPHSSIAIAPLIDGAAAAAALLPRARTRCGLCVRDVMRGFGFAVAQ